MIALRSSSDTLMGVISPGLYAQAGVTDVETSIPYRIRIPWASQDGAISKIQANKPAPSLLLHPTQGCPDPVHPVQRILEAPDPIGLSAFITQGVP
jgi:hypothetical protein